MKKTMKTLICFTLLLGMMSGCSKKEMDKDAQSSVNNSTQKAIDDTEDKGKNIKNAMDDNIDNVMNYFKDNGVTAQNMETIENMEFAAYEGRSFTNNGNKVYLYRVKNEDESMKKVMDEAKQNGMVKVKIDNKEQEYNAQVNGNFLLLYDQNSDQSDLSKLFPNYKMDTGTTNMK